MLCWDTILDPGQRILEKIARFILEPFARVFRRFFNPRFESLEAGIPTTNNTIGAILVRNVDVRDATTMTNRRIKVPVCRIGDHGAW